MRETVLLPLAERLAATRAEVVVCDPYVPDVNLHDLPFSMVPWSAAELAAADIVVVMVEHPVFDPDTIVANAQLVFDARNLLRGRQFNGLTL